MKIIKSLNKISMEVGLVLLSDCVSGKPKQGTILSDIGALLASKLAKPMQELFTFITLSAHPIPCGMSNMAVLCHVH